MSPPSRWFAALARLSLAARFRLAGAIVAAIGLPVSIWIRLTAADLPVRAISFDRLAVEERQLQIIGGKFAVEAARLSRWFDGLWVGPTLGLTLAVITLVVALACVRLAGIAARAPDDDDRTE